jgi:hypothetical protein
MLSQVSSLEIVIEAEAKSATATNFSDGLRVNYRVLQKNYERLRKLAWTTQNYTGGALNYRDYTNYVELRSRPRFC